MASTVKVESFSNNDPEAPIQGYFHLPDQPSGDGIVLTHGAGSNCNSPLIVALAESFAESGMMVLRCDLPFRVSRSQGPPPRASAERDQQGLRSAVEAVRQRVAGRVFLGGHSYGGRQASILAASEPKLADALLLLSYPLHPPTKPLELRTKHFPELQTAALFVHGTRDGFGTIEELTSAIKLIPARTELMRVENSGHELINPKNRASLPGEIIKKFAEFA